MTDFETAQKFNLAKPEGEKLRQEREKPYVSTSYIDLTRHGNRFGGPMTILFRNGETVEFFDSQELTPQGKDNSKKFGEEHYKNASLVHPRGGDELRHGQSGEDILIGSGKFGPARKTPAPVLFNEPAASKAITKLKGARMGKGIDYKTAGVMDVLKEAKQLINTTLQEKVNGLSDRDQEQFRLDPEYRALLREQAQIAGLKFAMEHNEPAVKTLAENEAYELMHDVQLSRRGVKTKEPKAITVVGSGLFAESLFKYALVVEDPQSGQKTIGFNNIEEIGGFAKPASAFRIKLTRDNSKGDARKLEDFEYDTAIECEFIGDPERDKLFQGKNIYLDWGKVKELAEKAKQRFEDPKGEN